MDQNLNRFWSKVRVPTSLVESTDKIDGVNILLEPSIIHFLFGIYEVKNELYILALCLIAVRFPRIFKIRDLKRIASLSLSGEEIDWLKMTNILPAFSRSSTPDPITNLKQIFMQ